MESFFGITNITAFILGTIFIVLLPGPNSLFVLAVALKRGKKAGFQGAMGIFSGDAILMLLTIFGAAGLLSTQPIIFNSMRYIGAFYLNYLGWQLIKTAIFKWRNRKTLIDNINYDIAKQSKEENIDKLTRPYLRALIISLMNPKAIFFFLFFFLSFIDTNYHNKYIPFIIEATIVQICSAVYLTMLIVFGIILAKKFQGHLTLHALLNFTAGILFCAYGVNLAFFL